MVQKILIVEDESELVQVLRDYLERAGFHVDAVYDGERAVSAFQQLRPDLVLLDLNLPGMDGFDVARAIRRHSAVPIIMLTARVEEPDRIIGLELGADDYVTKPFSPREVVARVRAVMRRSSVMPAPPEVFRAADIEIDRVRHKVTISGEQVELTPTEFNLLATLASQPGRVFTRMQLLEATQGETYLGYERTIDAHIKNLRAKIEPDPRQLRYIETVFGVGYRFKDV
jgi:two-component system alkaline phosphatase synthesis response regulator PhoP